MIQVNTVIKYRSTASRAGNIGNGFKITVIVKRASVQVNAVNHCINGSIKSGAVKSHFRAAQLQQSIGNSTTAKSACAGVKQ